MRKEDFRNFIKCFRAAVILILVISLAAGCGKPGSGSSEAVSENIVVAEKKTEADEMVMKPVAGEPDETAEDINNEIPSEDKRMYMSVREYLKDGDPGWNDSADYQAAADLYDTPLLKEVAEKAIERNGGVGKARAAYAYIDEDDIPEMLVSIGSFHAVGVNIFTYSSDMDKAIWLGEFSTNGQVSFNEKKNRIISSHGNQGYYMTNFSCIRDGKAELVGSVTEDSDGVLVEPDDTERLPYYKPLYYSGYKLPDGVDGSNKDGWPDVNGYDPEGAEVEEPGDEYLVSEEEYKSMRDKYLDYVDGDNIVSIAYSDMAEGMF